MEKRMKVLPICETKDMAREEVALFVHSPIFRKAEGEVISVNYYIKDMGWEYWLFRSVDFLLQPFKTNKRRTS